MQIEVTSNAKEAAQKLNRILVELPKAIRRALLRAGESVASSAKQTVVANTGRLRASIKAELVDNETARVGPSVGYGRYVELGRRKGSKFPPISAIQLWVEQRLRGTPEGKGKKADREKAARGLAFVIARAIARKGVQPRSYLKSSLDQKRDDIVKLMGRFVAQAVES